MSGLSLNPSVNNNVQVTVQNQTVTKQKATAQSQLIAGVALIALGLLAIALEAFVLGAVSMFCGAIYVLASLLPPTENSAEEGVLVVKQRKPSKIFVQQYPPQEPAVVVVHTSSPRAQSLTPQQTNRFSAPTAAPFNQLANAQGKRGVAFDVPQQPASLLPEDLFTLTPASTAAPFNQLANAQKKRGVAFDVPQQPASLLPADLFTLTPAQPEGPFNQLANVQEERGVAFDVPSTSKFFNAMSRAVPVSKAPANNNVGSAAVDRPAASGSPVTLSNPTTAGVQVPPPNGRVGSRR